MCLIGREGAGLYAVNARIFLYEVCIEHDTHASNAFYKINIFPLLLDSVISNKCASSSHETKVWGEREKKGGQRSEDFFYLWGKEIA